MIKSNNKYEFNRTGNNIGFNRINRYITSYTHISSVVFSTVVYSILGAFLKTNKNFDNTTQYDPSDNKIINDVKYSTTFSTPILFWQTTHEHILVLNE